MRTCFFLIVGTFCGLLQAATISGVITENGSGTKLDSVLVQLRSGTKVLATDTTTGEGAYSFANVDTGRYTIRASKTGYTTKSVADTIKTGKPTSSVNFALSAIIVATVAGSISDNATGTALSRVIIQLRSGTTVVKTDTSDSAGRYSFEKVEADSYTVRVSLAGYVSKSVTIKVRNSTPVTANILMSVAVITTVGGTVKDSTTGTALAGALIQLRYGLTVVRIDTSDVAGRYSFEKVEVDTYSVRTTFAGYSTKTIPFKLTDSIAVTVDVPLALIVTARVRGMVTDTVTGAAVFGAVVQLRLGTGIVATDTSGTDGIYSFENVQKGDYTIRVSSEAYMTKSIVTKVIDSTSVAVDIKLARKVYGRVSGKVVADSLPGVALEGASIILTGNGASTDTTTTDALGNFVFDSVETGTGYTISGSKTGFLTKSITIADKKNGVDTVVFFMKSLLAGNVIVFVHETADSAAIAWAAITFMSSGGSLLIPNVADSTGKALFEKMEEGTYAVSVSASGFTAKSKQYSMKNGSADTIKIYLAAVPGGTKTLHGTIVDSLSGHPVANVIVAMSINAGDAAPVTLAAKTGSDGNYSIFGISSAISAVTLTAKTTGYRISAKSAALGMVNTADTTRFDFKITQISSVIAAADFLHSGRQPEVSINPNGVISISNFEGNGLVRFFGLDGKLLQQYPFTSTGLSKTTVQPVAALPHATILVRISGSDGSAIICRKMMVGR